MPPFHPRSVPEASNIGFATMFRDILPVSMQRSGRGGAEVGFADRFPGILHISMQRSGCGNAVVGFATRNRRLLQQLAQRSGRRGAEVGFEARLLLYIFSDRFLDALKTTESSLEDGSVRADEHEVRNNLHAVDVCRHIAAVCEDCPVHFKLCCNR